MKLPSLKHLEPRLIRTILIQFAIVITYVTSYSMGIITAKYQPLILLYTDFIIVPITLLLFFFMYLLFITKEELVESLIDDKTREIVMLYGKGLSFEKIKDELNIAHVIEVKRAIVKFCNLKGVEK